jgi:hypothetical protein
MHVGYITKTEILNRINIRDNFINQSSRDNSAKGENKALENDLLKSKHVVLESSCYLLWWRR